MLTAAIEDSTTIFLSILVTKKEQINNTHTKEVVWKDIATSKRIIAFKKAFFVTPRFNTVYIFIPIASAQYCLKLTIDVK